MKSTQVFYTQTQETKKGVRIWLEGKRLEDAGFSAGQKYNAFFNRETKVLELVLNDNGDKVVSKKSRYEQLIPIIDLCNKSVFDLFGVDAPIVAKVIGNKIIITQHQMESNRLAREAELIDLLNNQGLILEGSLCSGGGISTHAINAGLEASGLNSKVTLLAECDPRYLQVAKNLFPLVDTIHQGKIEDVILEDIPKLNVLSFSLPCTGHSPQGKTKNNLKMAEEHKDAGTAVFGCLKYVVASNPSVIISENVIQAKDSATYILMRAELRRIGYEIREFILDEQQAGAIEKRKRYWFVAVSSGFKEALEDIHPEVFRKKYKTVGDVLEKRYGGGWIEASYFDKRQEANDDMGRGFKKNFVSDSSDSVGVIPRNYTKRQISNPHYQKGNKIRLFTPAEHSRLKGIPEHIVEGVCDTVAHEILGQSILYNQALGLAQATFKALQKLLCKKEVNLKKRLAS